MAALLLGATMVVIYWVIGLAADKDVTDARFGMVLSFIAGTGIGGAVGGIVAVMFGRNKGDK